MGAAIFDITVAISYCRTAIDGTKIHFGSCQIIEGKTLQVCELCLERLKVREVYQPLLLIRSFFSSVAYSCYTMTQPYYYQHSLHLCFFKATCPLVLYNTDLVTHKIVRPNHLSITVNLLSYCMIY